MVLKLNLSENACPGGIEEDGGLGGNATGTLAVTPGQVFEILFCWSKTGYCNGRLISWRL